MKLYPLFLNLSSCRCLVVGAGRVGRRKIAGLLACEPKEVLVLDLAEPQELGAPELADWIAGGRILFRQRAFVPEDVEGCALVFAATSNRSVNAAVLAACRERGILCNSADDPEGAAFFVPARVDCGGLSLALSTGGGSPALAAQVRRDLEKWVGERYAGLAEILRRLRPLVLAVSQDSDRNGDLFRRLVHSPLRELLIRRDAPAATALLREMLPPELHERITDLLHDLA